MKNIHILPTDKPSRLHEYDLLFLLALSKRPLQWRLGRNIYITSDEEIKEGDWYLTKDEKPIKELFSIGRKGKIILTTDQDLVKDGVQPIPYEFLKWFVKNSSCEEAEVINEQYTQNYHKDIWYNRYKIIIPKEKPRQETLEEAAERIYPNYQQEIFIEGAKWQQEQDKNKYSEEEEVLEFANWCRIQDNKYPNRVITTQQLFEQFKKK